MDRKQRKNGLIGGNVNGTWDDILSHYAGCMDVGETVRINHADCEAGEDTRRRLYITMKPDILLGYCHNCGTSRSK